MKTKKQRIIEEWQKTKIVHPSYGEIAKKVGVVRSYAFEVIQQFLAVKK